MVKGTLKGDSAMAQAINELITGEAVPEAETASPAASPAAPDDEGARGAKTVALHKRLQEAF